MPGSSHLKIFPGVVFHDGIGTPVLTNVSFLLRAELAFTFPCENPVPQAVAESPEPLQHISFRPGKSRRIGEYLPDHPPGRGETRGILPLPEDNEDVVLPEGE